MPTIGLTFKGGLSAVIWTDFIQSIIMVIGALFLTIKSYMAVGGWSSFITKYPYAISRDTIFSNATCGLPPANVLNMIRDVNSDYPWTGMTFGVIINSVWYWCSEYAV